MMAVTRSFARLANASSICCGSRASTGTTTRLAFSAADRAFVITANELGLVGFVRTATRDNPGTIVVSKSSSLHLLRSWSLRSTRGGSCCFHPAGNWRLALHDPPDALNQVGR